MNSGNAATRIEDGISAEGLRSLPLEADYRTGPNDLVQEFYVPCLRQANTFDRAIGYFRSSVYDLTGEAVLQFALRGGRLRLVCSPALEDKDVEAMKAGYRSRAEICSEAMFREVHSLLASPDAQERTRILASLIRHHVLDVMIAIPTNSEGIYHEKLGIFRDDKGNAVSFKGSANETWRGWSRVGNIETIDVFCSWGESSERTRIDRHQDHFDRLWSNTSVGIEIIPLPDLAREALIAVSHDDMQQAMPRQTRTSQKRLQAHQQQALDAWYANGERGILEHATGSGKTLTAIEAIKRHTSSGKPALILVPSKLLVKQWKKELATEIPGTTVMRAGGGHTGWRVADRLTRMSTPNPRLEARVIVATMMTAATPEFRSKLTQGKDLLLVADEVHATGSPQQSACLEIEAGARLGLSATPERYGDPDGTKTLMTYFGGVLQPPFTLADAIRVGRLVPYQYFPQFADLNEAEMQQWREVSAKINRAYAMSHSANSRDVSEQLKLLLILRARIAKQATGKVQLAANLLAESFQTGQRWLVYCDDVRQLKNVRRSLDETGVQTLEYHSQMEGDPVGTLDWFRTQGGVLVSVRCLDEGVDIPEVTHALILASSQNPRQFIQRRGRVLRAANGKAVAVIHDCLVLPSDEADAAEMKALARSELKRALTFAKSALNKGAETVLSRAAIDRGIDLTEPTEDTEEEEQSDE